MRQLVESFGLTCVQAYKMDATRALLPAPEQARSQQPGEAQAPSTGGQVRASSGGESRGRRGGLTQPISAATLRKVERVAAAKRARGLEPAPSAHVAEGKEAVCRGFPPASFDYVLCDAPCTALGLRPRCVG